MALATQCPHCFTSFRVANDQLKLHAGLVRCGSCKQTFNGIEHLLAPGEAPRQAPVTSYTAEHDTAETATTAITTDTTQTTDEGLAENDLSASGQIVEHTTQNDDTNNTQISTQANISDDGNSFTDSEYGHRNFHTEQSNENPIGQFEINTAIETAEDKDLEAQEGSEISQDALNASPSITPNAIAQEIDEYDEVFSTEKFDTTIPESPKVPNELAQQEDLMQEFSAQLETIEPESEEAPAKTKSNKAASLTSGLEFELTNEERELVEQADFLHQLELENRAEILDTDANEWSKNETGFDEQSLLAAFATEEALRTQENHFSENAPVETRHNDALSSAPENNVLAQNDTHDDEMQVKPDFVLQAEKKRRYGKWQNIALSFACLLLVLGITAQSIYFFRSTIAAEIPASKAHLLRACQLLTCQISLPAERHMLELGGSELLILNEELMINTLAFQIQNKSNTVQEWPALELTLKDVRGKTVLQKVFLPGDYLNNKADLPKGIAARSESNHKLHFELRPSKASNYEVSIFYP
jgi:predicted Zn finger-like uncharacterized protein